MKSKISALMDGELERHEAGGAARRAQGRGRGARHLAQLPPDRRRDARHAAAVGRVSPRAWPAKLAEEPTVLAPRAARRGGANAALALLSAAASLAAVALVGWVAFATAGRAQLRRWPAGRAAAGRGGPGSRAGRAARGGERLSARPPGLLAAQLPAGRGALRAHGVRARCAAPQAMMRGLGIALAAVRQPVRGADAAADGAGCAGAAAQDLPGDREAFLHRHLRLPAGRAHRDLAHHPRRRARAATSSGVEVLDGMPREIVRTRDTVRCYLPESQTVKVERRIDQRAFPGDAAGADLRAGAQLHDHPRRAAAHRRLRLRGGGADAEGRPALRLQAVGRRRTAACCSRRAPSTARARPSSSSPSPSSRSATCRATGCSTRHAAQNWRIEDAAVAPANLARAGWIDAAPSCRASAR